jgi:protocatechuate 3,4-dioxygenase beta subunit
MDRIEFPRRSRHRRKLLAGVGASGAVLLASHPLAQIARTETALPACMLTPEQTEGPYFVDEKLNRSDIRSEAAGGSTRPGALLTLQLNVLSVAGGRCAPLPGAIIDIWHCDAAGLYSDVDETTARTKGSRFLRGYQVSDANGRVRFTTIYPGAYPGRAVHIHFKVRTKAAGRNADFTSQLYFDDTLTDQVHAQPPYAGAGARRTRNARDGLYRQGGTRLQLAVAATGDGYAATYEVGVDAS